MTGTAVQTSKMSANIFHSLFCVTRRVEELIAVIDAVPCVTNSCSPTKRPELSGRTQAGRVPVENLRTLTIRIKVII